MKWPYLILSAIPLLVGSSAFANPLVPSRTLDISFTEFCDGMHLDINERTGLVSGYTTGCTPGAPIFGTVGSNSKIGASITVLSFGLIYILDNDPQVFKNYFDNGSQLHDGGYAVDTAAARRTGRASSAR